MGGETALAAYKTFRDAAIFTNKRLIVRDAQGFTGKKIEIYSLPYSSIFMWSSENGHGIFNFNSEIELWTKAGHIKINLNKGIDVRRLDKLISEAVLQATLFLNITPWGEVFVNGKSQGVSPPKKFMKLDPGKYKIEIRNTTFPVHAENVEVKAREEVTLKHRFQ